jgi:hypothetical protein
MAFSTPIIKITHHINLPGIGRPDGKMNALLSIYFNQMSAQLLVDTFMRTLIKKKAIKIADKGTWISLRLRA